MRIALAVALVLACPACELYFSDPPATGPGTVPDLPDSGPHPWPDPQPGARIARCEGGALYQVDVGDYAPEQPGHGAGAPIGRCEGACRSAAAICPGGDCELVKPTLCGAPASAGVTCAFEGDACTGSSTIECPSSTTCGYAVPGSTCACTNGAYACTPRTDLAGTHAALVGRWTGTVTPPSFAQPYPVSLWIYPDGTYWAETPGVMPSFYYGGDGPHPDRRITLLSRSATEGAWADIGIYFGGSPPNIGAIASLVVGSNRLAFTYYASWHGCGQPFYFELAREPGTP